METIIRHFTDTAEQKKEQRELADTLRQQLARAEERADKAREFSRAVDRIMGDYCRAAGTSPRQVSPWLTAQQIAEAREFAEKLPALHKDRIEFHDAANQAERQLQDREAAEQMRQAQETRARKQEERSRERESSHQRDTMDRSDSSSRGR